MTPFPQYYFSSSSSSFHPSPPPLPHPAILNQEEIFLHQNHQDPLSGHFLLHNSQIPETLLNLGASSSNGASMTKQDIANFNGVAPDFLGKRPTKKDRHSKICTAQGLRDRRVRLSIDIAREFFDLHDMLGFDKASKTLEWLLTKSKKAIKDLARTKLGCSTSGGSTSECEAVSEVNEVADDGDLERALSRNKDKTVSELDEAALTSLLAKESRAKARARARARTKEKRCTNKSQEPQKCPETTQISNPLRAVLNQLQDCERSTQKFIEEMNQEASSLRLANQTHQETNMIKRKYKLPSISGNYDHHQHLSAISRGESSNNMAYSSNLPHNWDINSASPRPSFMSWPET
ncbi:hypothetical protein UlMin_014424 [Ulmus minor]